VGTVSTNEREKSCNHLQNIAILLQSLHSLGYYSGLFLLPLVHRAQHFRSWSGECISRRGSSQTPIWGEGGL
jgi:hypothetical protein